MPLTPTPDDPAAIRRKCVEDAVAPHEELSAWALEHASLSQDFKVRADTARRYSEPEQAAQWDAKARRQWETSWALMDLYDKRSMAAARAALIAAPDTTPAPRDGGGELGA